LQNTFERGTEKLDSKDAHLLAETSLFSSETFQCELERKAHTILYTAFVSNRLENFGCYPKKQALSWDSSAVRSLGLVAPGAFFSAPAAASRQLISKLLVNRTVRNSFPQHPFGLLDCPWARQPPLPIATEYKKTWHGRNPKHTRSTRLCVCDQRLHFVGVVTGRTEGSA